mmetsp:Transcript_13616/g.37681  ORF Transcript_13616/g.37681 Transcript_13616/m.37681 type:complete len:89 (+) Transcript_13616:632-898(+)
MHPPGAAAAACAAAAALPCALFRSDLGGFRARRSSCPDLACIGDASPVGGGSGGCGGGWGRPQSSYGPGPPGSAPGLQRSASTQGLGD